VPRTTRTGIDDGPEASGFPFFGPALFGFDPDLAAGLVTGFDDAVRPPLAGLLAGRASPEPERAVGAADVRGATVPP